MCVKVFVNSIDSVIKIEDLFEIFWVIKSESYQNLIVKYVFIITDEIENLDHNKSET